MVRLTILGSESGAGSSCLHHMQLCGRPFSVDTQVKINYCLFQCIQKQYPNTRFFLSTGKVNNPLIFPWFYNSMLDKYDIGNCRVSVLITPMGQSPFFYDYVVAGTDAKYASAQTIIFMLAHVSTISFSTFVP